MWAKKELSQETVGDLEFRPLLPGVASCGPGGEIGDPGPTAKRLPFSSEFLQGLIHEAGAGNAEDLFVVECVGESMRPTVHPGDLAIINTALELRMKPQPTGLYLVRPEVESTEGRIKRIRMGKGTLSFLSDAPGFPPRTVDVDGVQIQSLVLGRVCWISRTVLREERLDSNW